MTRVNGLMAKSGRSSGRPFSLMTVYFDADDDCFRWTVQFRISVHFVDHNDEEMNDQ